MDTEQQWTPGGTDLVGALPDLVAAKSREGFTVRRVMYNPADWDSHTPRRLTVNGSIIKLGAFNYQEQHTVTLVEDDGRSRITMLVPTPLMRTVIDKDAGERAQRARPNG